MAKAAVFIVMVLAILWVLIWGGQKPQVQTNTDTTPIASAIVPRGSQSIKLYEQNNSGVMGVTDMLPENGKTRVVITITGKKSKVAQPAHVHAGMCPIPNEIEFALNDVVNGVSNTLLDISMDDLLSKRELAVNIHKSYEEVASYVSCGDVLR